MRNSITNKICLRKKEYITNIIHNSHNSKGLWRVVSLAAGQNEYNDNVPTDITSDVLNDYFSDIGSQLIDQTNHVTPLWTGPVSSYTFIFAHINAIYTYSYLTNLPDKTNVGILLFDAKLLRLSAHLISSHLTNLFNASLAQGTVPHDWKKAKVTPIYKGKGSRSDCSNCRPISVICHIAKIFEKCVQTQLMTYLDDHNFISCDQSAFLKNHSTVTTIKMIMIYITFHNLWMLFSQGFIKLLLFVSCVEKIMFILRISAKLHYSQIQILITISKMIIKKINTLLVINASIRPIKFYTQVFKRNPIF